MSCFVKDTQVLRFLRAIPEWRRYCVICTKSLINTIHLLNYLILTLQVDRKSAIILLDIIWMDALMSKICLFWWSALRGLTPFLHPCSCFRSVKTTCFQRRVSTTWQYLTRRLEVASSPVTSCMREGGMTSKLTSRSAVAREERIVFVLLFSFLTRHIAMITMRFPVSPATDIVTRGSVIYLCNHTTYCRIISFCIQCMTSVR